MNAVVVDVTPENPGNLVGKLKPTRLRHAVVQQGFNNKLRTLLGQFPDSPQFPLKYIITRPHNGFNPGYVMDLFEENIQGLLVFRGILTNNEIKTLQDAGFRISVYSKAWNDSSYLVITK